MPTWKEPGPEHGAFKCCTAWHLCSSGAYLATYDFIGGLTAGGTNAFFSSIRRVAAFFDRDYETQRRIFANLTKMGWLRFEPYEGKRRYWYVNHSDWVKTHPDKCAKRVELQWEVEADPFVGQLFAAAAGKFYIREGWVKGLRKFATDSEFLDLFRKEIEAAKCKRAHGDWNKTGSKECFWRVYNHLRQQARELVGQRIGEAQTEAQREEAKAIYNRIFKKP